MNCSMRGVLLDARQLSDDLAAEPDEETGEYDRHDPARELKEAFGDSQALEHGGDSGKEGRPQP